MAQAGYPNGFSTSYMYIAGNSPASDRFAQVLKSQLGAVGIDLTLDPVDTPTYLARLGKATTAWPSTIIRTSRTRCSTRARGHPATGRCPMRFRGWSTRRELRPRSTDYLQTIRDLSVTEDDQGFPNMVVASPTQFIAYRRSVSNVKLDFSISWLFLTKVIKH